MKPVAALGSTIGAWRGFSASSPNKFTPECAGKRPIPHKYLLALAFLIGRLTGEIAAWIPPQTRYARRAEIAHEAASKWCALALLELMEDLGGDINDHPDLTRRGYELGEAALAKLVRQ